MFERLSGDLVVRIVSWLDNDNDDRDDDHALGIESAVENLSRVCRAWNRALGPDQKGVWDGLLVATKHPVLSDTNSTMVTKNRSVLKFVELKQKLKKRGIRATGNKANLVALLEKSDLERTEKAKEEDTKQRKTNPKAYFFKTRHKRMKRHRKYADDLISTLFPDVGRSDFPKLVEQHLHLFAQENGEDRRQLLFRLNLNKRVHYSGHRTTLLHYACLKGRHETVENLLNMGANQHVVDDNNASPLLLAASAGREEVVEVLLKHLLPTSEADLEKRKHLLALEGVPPLGFGLRWRCGETGPETAVCWAKRNGFHSVAYMIENSINYHMTIQSNSLIGWVPLHQCILNGRRRKYRSTWSSDRRNKRTKQTISRQLR